jgi:signal transduction histidine kinase
MFSVKGSSSALSRRRLVLSFVLLFWLGAGCFLLTFLWLVRGILQDREMARANAILDAYLQQKQVDDIGGRLKERGQEPGGLLFIRLIRGGSHVVRIHEHEGHAPAFKDLMTLAPDESKPWVRLENGDYRAVLNIVSRPVDGGGVIQVGIIAGEGYQLYRLLVRAGLIGGGIVFFVSWPLAFACTAVAGLPLRRLRQTLDILENQHDLSAVIERSDLPELDLLGNRLAELVERNRKLLAEMQASLDNVAHDLRTPMTRLRSVAEYGLQAGNDPGKLRESLSDCLEESERVLAMLGIMMRVAEAESGAMRLDLVACDLHRSITDVVEMYEYVAQEKEIAIRVDMVSELQIRADRVRIAQVWGNLLDNAIKYGRRGGWVEISAHPDGEGLRIDFSDNGIGISQNEIGRIWERLYRGDRSRSQPGLGLGLNYVRAVIEAHGGEVLVKSTLHQGSCFSILLPAVAECMPEEADRQVKSQTNGA